jgi:hypothetical protein
MISEWFREVTYDRGSVRDGFRHIQKVLEGLKGSEILWKVLEVSRMNKVVLISPERSMICVSMFP